MRTCLAALCVPLLASLPQPVAAAGPADSVVKVSASVRYPNPARPWARGERLEIGGTGVVIEGKRVLTNAHLVQYAAEVYVQGRPGEDRVEATVEFIGPEVDLAVLRVKEDSFFQKRPALARARKLPGVQDRVVVYGFPVGGEEVSVTRGAVSRIGFGLYSRNGSGLTIEVNATINPGNSGGPAVADSAMVGLVFSRSSDSEGTGYIIPNEEIETFLEDVKDGRYDGKPTDLSGTTFQRLENPALRRSLKLDAQVKGVLVLPPQSRAADYPFRESDVLTGVGGYAVDNEGMVQMRGDLRVPFFMALPRAARDNTVPIRVFRAGKPVDALLPVTTRDDRLIREFRGEKPSYFIHGPLVFSPARSEAVSWYLRANSGLAGDSPLMTRRWDRVRFAGEELVVVTSPLFTHKVARGYDDPVGRVVKDVNGVTIRNLAHLVEVLRDATGEFVRFRFAEENGDVLIFDRKEMEGATEEVLEENGITPSRRGSEDVLKVWNRKAVPRP